MSGTTKITAEASFEQLPDDVATLRQMVLTLLGQIDDLSGQLYYLKRQLFGKKSEKLNPGQRFLFENLYQEIEAKIEQQKPPKAEPVKKNENHKGRNPLPPELPRETIEIKPLQEDQVCTTCNTPKDIIGTEVTEKLEYRPACFFVKQYVRYKMGCKKCEGNLSIGALPAMAIDKGIAGEGLLAHIITSKYCDHLPLNRLEGIFKRSGVEINVSTLCDWVGKSTDLLEPLVKRMHQTILQSRSKANTAKGLPTTAICGCISMTKTMWFLTLPPHGQERDLWNSWVTIAARYRPMRTAAMMNISENPALSRSAAMRMLAENLNTPWIVIRSGRRG
jgi:transposase